MILETIHAKGLAHLSYLVGDEAAGVCTVIDPRRDVSVYLDLARKYHCRITHVFETHIHADFVSGGRELAALTGATIVGGTSPAYAFQVHQAREGEKFAFGNLTFEVLHTPGHTPEHISLVLAGGKGSEAPWGVFTGDTLFAGEVGRPDLLGHGTELELAGQLFHTLHEKLFKLGDEVEIYPAHGQGSPCGGSIGDRNTSTIGYERRHLPKAQLQTEEEFVAAVLQDLPPAPTYYPRMKQVNAAGARVIGCLPNLQPLSPQAFADASQHTNVLVLDTREIEAFGGGHVPGGLNIALRDEFPVWSGWMLQPEQQILLVVDQETDIDLIQRHLLRIGIENIAGFLRHGMRGWFEAGLDFEALGQLSVHRLASKGSSAYQILDVRTPGEWSGGHIAGAIPAFVPKLAAAAEKLDRGKPVAVYCGSGYRASIAASLLQTKGFRHVFNVPGGMKAWKATGLPITTD